jgi:hypothetical protein
MPRNSFLHVPGIGSKTEQNIWSGGILSWNDLLKGGSGRIYPKKRDIIARCIEESIEHLSSKNPTFFGDRLPSNQFWRIFPEFRESVAYLDIETMV